MSREEQLFFEHVRKGQLKELRELLQRTEIDINATGDDQRTPLHLAAINGQLEVVQCLVENGADIKAKDRDQLTPLHLAAKYGHLEVVQCLVENGADIKATDWCQLTPLHLAAQNGNLKVAQYLVEEKGADINAKDLFQRTPLYFAAEGGHLKMVQYLVENGADINATDQNQRTPLNLAARNDKLEVVKYLVGNGADINAKDLYLASGNLKMVQCLVKNGADINAINKDQRTPLHLAAKWGRLEEVKYLVEKGADINAKDRDQQTPLHLAAEGGHLKMVQYLVENGADINAKDRDQQTPLHLAARYGRLEVVQCLVENGADINAKDRDQQTPLDLAEEKGRQNIFSFIKEHLINSIRNDISKMLAEGKQEDNTIAEALRSTAQMLKNDFNKLTGILGIELPADNHLPDEYMCPITREKMNDPVVLADGHTCERAAIQRWFDQGRNTSPKTGLPLDNTHLIPNINLKSAIGTYEERTLLSVQQLYINLILKNVSPAPQAGTDDMLEEKSPAEAQVREIGSSPKRPSSGTSIFGRTSPRRESASVDPTDVSPQDQQGSEDRSNANPSQRCVIQ